ncbi:MAG: hypothetical protein ABID87_07110 [Chloroflexota bacterium]
MLRFTIALLTAFSLFTTAPVIAADASGGVVQAQVVNGTAGGGSVSGVELTLRTMVDNAETGVQTGTADESGGFTFTGLSTDISAQHRLSAVYRDVTYYSEPFSFTEGNNIGEVTITVFETMTDDTDIFLPVTHTIIYVNPEGLQVKEYYVVVNQADRTYIGPQGDPAQGTLRFSLPQDAKNLQITLGLNPHALLIGGGTITDTIPLTPGGREISFAYTLPASKSYTFHNQVSYRTMSYALLVAGEGYKVSSDQLQPGEPLEVSGSRFEHFKGGELAAGTTVTALITPASGDYVSFLWIIPVIAVAAGLFIFYRARGRKAPAAVPLPGGTGEAKEALLAEIARLDDAFENGAISEEDYRMQRDEKKTRLVEVMQDED